MGKSSFVVCSSCGAKLLNSAVCINCENAGEKKAYQELCRDIIAIVKRNKLILRKKKKCRKKLMEGSRKKKKTPINKR